MNRKYMALLLVALLLPCCIAVPAKAAEPDNFGWIDLLDYSSVTDTGNSFGFSGSGSVTLDCPSEAVYVYADILVQYNMFYGIDVPTITIANIYGNSVTLSGVSLGNGIYRYSGNLVEFSYSSLTLGFSAATDFSYTATILGCRLSSLRKNFFNAPASGVIRFNDSSRDQAFSIDSNLYRNYAIPVVEVGLPQDYRAFVDCSDWKKYDYYTFIFECYCSNITSVSAYQGSKVLPFTVSYLNDSAFVEDPFIFTVCVDLRGVDRSSEELPQVVFTGNCYTIDIGANGFAINSCQGEIDISYTDPEVTWLQKIKNSIDGFWKDVGAWFSGLTHTVATWGQNIVDAFSPDTGAADEVVNDAVSKGDQIGGLNDQMNSVEKPDLSGSGDISGIISPGDMSTSTTFLTTVVNAPYIGQVVMLSLILSLAAYVLFGKRS